MTSPSPTSSALAKAAASTRWAELPDEVRVMALDLFADAIGVIAGGSVHPSMVAFTASVAPSDGPSTLIGARRGAATRDAVLLNAATITVLQRQDGYAHAKGHPAAQLVPLVLALAEREPGATADAMLSAFVAGYEVAARVGAALGGVPSHLHDIGNWVTVGCAAAAAHVLSEGDASTVAAAIDGAASMALAFDRYTTAGGATMHHLYPALATTQALAIAEGAAAGLTELPGSLERFYAPTFGTHPDAARLVDGIGGATWSRFEILNGYFKLHPSCAHLHGVNDAVDLLLAEEHISEKDIVSVDVSTFGEAMEIDTSTPHNDLAARFSAKATVAAAIRHGCLDDDGLLDLEALEPLMERISVRHDPDLDRHLPAGRPGVVTMRLANGREVTRSVVFPRGTAQVLATRDERRAKVLALLARAYGHDGASAVHDAVMALGAGGDLARLTGSLRR
jgi:2-methylcitrate dehydratase PrpD